MATTCSNSTAWSRPYPPTNRDGMVDEHDKPFFYYGHLGIIYISAMIILSYYLYCLVLDAATIARMRNFRLPSVSMERIQEEKSSKSFKLNCHKMAMSGFTEVSSMSFSKISIKI